MARIQLKKEIQGKKTITVTKKDALWADVCDCCQKVYQMKSYCNDNVSELGRLKGTFLYEGHVRDSDGDGMGNMFDCIVCSFACAQKIMDGGWKNIKRYKPFTKKEHQTTIVRAELKITTLITEKNELLKEWHKKPEKCSNMPLFGSCVGLNS